MWVAEEVETNLDSDGCRTTSSTIDRLRGPGESALRRRDEVTNLGLDTPVRRPAHGRFAPDDVAKCPPDVPLLPRMRIR